MQTQAANAYQAVGTNQLALFTLKIHRGEGMALLAMNWKSGEPPSDFVGFSIEYKEPDGIKFFALKNRLVFKGKEDDTDPNKYSTLRSPIQKFRWVHFPRNAEMAGQFTYKVKPVFMNSEGELSYGEKQEVSLALCRENYPGKLNVAFTRGFVSSQAFADKYAENGGLKKLLPAKADEGLDFVATHPNAEEALKWMGFEAYNAILEVLDKAIEDPDAKVQVIAYDCNVPAIVDRLKKLKHRLQIIIDDSADHGLDTSAESKSFELLGKSAGKSRVKRQHMGNLQHNKMIVVTGSSTNFVVLGSTNFSWRGFFIQGNNAIVLTGEAQAKIFSDIFEKYFATDNDSTEFASNFPAKWVDLGIDGIDVQASMSPHNSTTALLKDIGDDIETGPKTSVLYSLAFLGQTTGAIRDAITNISDSPDIFVYGMADKEVGGLEVTMPNGNLAAVHPAMLKDNVPSPFKEEVSGGRGIQLHHKFVVIDFNTDDARVYMGSYNFSRPADVENGENILLIKDRTIATSYMIEAVRLFDHYQFRILQGNAETAQTTLSLQLPPEDENGVPWWKKDFTEKQRIKDRELFA